MSIQNNQKNKEIVWDMWQKINHVGIDNVPDVIRAVMHKNVNWNASAPIDHIEGVEAVINNFWRPMFHSFPDLKIKPYIFMGGTDGGESIIGSNHKEEWVSGCGY
ncbi:MAG: hypothetical protein ACI85U_003410, partial [Candidatus Promineifilaceae bacterium]